MDGKNDIIAIFHEVKTDVQGKSLPGSFVIANQMGKLIFWWREYRKNTKNDQDKPTDIKLYLSNVQKIMVNYQENDSYILITTISPSNMQQFNFPPSSSYHLMQFTQILAIKQQMSDANSIEEAMDFISATYTGESTQKRLIELKNENGRIEFPSFLYTTDFMQQNNNNIEFMQLNDNFFTANFDVNPELYMKNPVKLEDLKEIKSFEVLKAQVRDRGLSSDIRHILWPVLCQILPFDEGKRQEILKVRMDEYLSIRHQWETYSKLQIKNFSLLLESFATIRVDVKRTYPHESVVSFDNWNVMLTNILRSFSLWNLNVRYTQGLNDLAVNFMGIFLPQVLKDELKVDEAESLAFWCFSSFIEIINSGITAENLMACQTKEVKIIGSIIDKFHPVCFDWLRSHNLSDLLFIMTPLMLAFARSFAYNDIFRIWESVVCSKSPSSFLRFFAASLVIHCFPYILKQSECSMGRILQTIDKIVLKQNVGSVIGYAIAMINKCNSDEFDEPVTFKKDQTPENEFFTLDDANALEYSEIGNLFI